jgi:hypothetical protein
MRLSRRLTSHPITGALRVGAHLHSRNGRRNGGSMSVSLTGPDVGLPSRRIAARGVRHQIDVWVNRIAQGPVIDYQQIPDRKVKIGTSVTIEWPAQASSLLDDEKSRFLLLAQNFGWLNPHLSLEIDWHGERQKVKRAAQDWEKWLPSLATSAHWYGVEQLERLAAAYLSHDGFGRTMTLREFIGLFDGFTSSAKRKKVTDDVGFTRQTLDVLLAGDAFEKDALTGLLSRLKEHSRPVKPRALGLIGKEHLYRNCAAIGAEMATFKYRKIEETGTDGVPWLAEVAFAALPEETEMARIITGINWSPTMPGGDPFDDLGDGNNLKGLLADQWIHHCSPIVLVIHVVIPRTQFFDRGKGRCDLGERGPLLGAEIRKVTSAWAKQMKREEREANARLHRHAALGTQKKVKLWEAAFEVMEEAYLKASSGRTLPAKPRQIYYAARAHILERTGKTSIGGQYFSQKLLVRYVRENPETTANWDIIWDARGNFTEPHTGKTFPLGTLEAREYLRETEWHCVGSNDLPRLSLEYPTCGPKNRFGAILFVEKEGFGPLFERSRLAERFDLAIMSSKGMSVTAARLTIDRLCGGHDIPVLIVRDFDKAGFSIARTLVTDSPRYRFKNHITSIDLGLRLVDAESCGLESEDVSYGKNDPRDNLRKNGATEEEIEFLCDNSGPSWAPHFRGRRVELNAFTSGELISWLESKLVEHGITKVVPDDQDLERAYRWMLGRTKINERLETIADEVRGNVERASFPKGLRERLVAKLDSNRALTWDAVLESIIAASA